MKPEQILQKMIDEASSMYSMGEEADIFNSKQKKAEEILRNMGKEFQQFNIIKDTHYDYKSLSELNQMSIEGLKKELHAIQLHNEKLEEESQKLKNAEKLTSFLINEKIKSENNNSLKVNQIKKRGNNGNNNASKNK